MKVKILRLMQNRAQFSQHKKHKHISKLHWKPSTLLAPVPAVMVTSCNADGKPNICTVAWTGTICSDPPMLSISLRPATHSHSLIRDSGEFVVNVPSISEMWATDYCGVVSGRDVDKFKEAHLTPGKSLKVKPPIIMECPLNIECKVRQTINLGSHTMFIAEVLAVQASENLMTKSGRLALENAGIFAYAHGHYYALGSQLGHFGFSVRKKKKQKGC